MIFNSALFDPETISRLLSHFQVLLEGIVANPDRSISDLPILTEPEKHQLLVEWNDTKREYPKGNCIHELFEPQVERSPGAVALVFGDHQLSYRELNRQANQLAHYLRKLGVGPESRVGICLERSPEMIIGLLGILKAGGAYVPLDPSYPGERLEFMLADAQISILLTQSELFEDSGSRIDDSDPRTSILHAPIQRVRLDKDWAMIATESDTNPGRSATPENLAYVIYTSGSTGKPKGVAIEHRNTVAFLAWAHCAFAKEELSGVLAATSISFDLSVFEIFAPLTCGGTIVLAENALALATMPTRPAVTLVNTVPSAMHELLRLDAIPPSVRVINLAGEALRADLVRRIYQSTSVHKVHDLYGPSECTTYSTWTRRSADGPQTIGRPIANTRIYILDGHRNPVPIGVSGEIFIGGDGVARGYLNRPELTAEKFIQHSFDGEPVERLYKTGDLGRYLPGGNIEFLGRIDHQVKLRGFRIELGEIQGVLGEHAKVRQSVVVLREDLPADEQLVAYVVPEPETSELENELQRFLKSKLPDYMIPAQFVFLEFLPLTSNGKLDRRALPAPDRNGRETVDTDAGPWTAVEKLMADIWKEVLNLDGLAIRDNFFDIGGHSLKATQVISRVRDTFGVDLPLRLLFEAPTIAAFAARLEQSLAVNIELHEIESLSDEDAKRRLQ